MSYSKAHLEQDISMLNIEIPSTSKVWEPYRAYEKRLVTASTKEKGILSSFSNSSTILIVCVRFLGPTGRRSGRPRNEPAKSADPEASDTDDAVVEDLIQHNGLPSQSTPRVRPRPAYGKKAAVSVNGAETDGSELSQLSSDEHEHDDLLLPAAITNGIGASPLRTPSPTRSTGGMAKMIASSQTSIRKRPRTLDVDEGDGLDAAGEQSGATEDELPEGASASATQTGEIIVRRKRIRH